MKVAATLGSATKGMGRVSVNAMDLHMQWKFF